MNFTQNEKINQVKETTIIIGIDIASEVHYARAFNWRGIELGKVISFDNNREGFIKLQEWIGVLQQRHGLSEVLLGAEPTGHYWFGFADFAKANGMLLVLVNPYHVKQSKELDDNSPTKNDRKDPKTIANLVIAGRYMMPYIPEGVYADLRIAVYTSDRIQKDLIGLKNRMERWLKIYFPEYKTVFSSSFGRASLLLLKHAPLPEDLQVLGVQGINDLWRIEKLRAVGIKRAKDIFDAAQTSIGRKEGLSLARLDLALLIEEYELKINHLTLLEETIETLCFQIPEVEKMLAIKGVGMATIAGFFAEVGDLKRFDSPKQIQKLAGLAIRETSSGKHQGASSISRRGRKRLRTLLFQVILPLVGRNEAFKTLHEYYTTRKNNPLKKKQSLIALCCKLIRIFFGISKKGFEFDEKKLLGDIKRPASPIAA
jgi:transposase